MEREIINLTNEQWCNLINEEYLKINGEEIDIREVDDVYEGSSRHTEHHYKIFERISDGKFFKVGYETSVKDSMGWDECNYGNTTGTEVFPVEKTIITYE